MLIDLTPTILSKSFRDLFTANSDEFNSFEDIHFYNESKESICESACNFERYSNLELLTFYAKKPDKKGFFERFFQFFE